MAAKNSKVKKATLIFRGVVSSKNTALNASSGFTAAYPDSKPGAPPAPPVNIA